MGQTKISHEPQVGLVAYALQRNARGIGQYTLRLLAGLHAIGEAPLVLRSGDWPASVPGDAYPSVGLPGSGLLPALLTLGQVQVGWHAWRRGLTLVHDPNGIMPLGLCAAKRVITICDTIPYVYPEVCTTLDRLIYHQWLPRVIKNLDAVITISQHSKADIRRYLNVPENKIMVTPLAAGARFCQLPEEAIGPALQRAGVERPYILYVGSVEPRKNLLRLLDAYQELLGWLQRWRLVIVGARNYWRSSPVAQKVAQLGLGERVTFTGYIPDEDLPALYNGADLFCFPSLYEGFGLPVLEAMACGTPVVAANSSSLPEVAGEAAVMIDPYNVPEMCAAMRRVLEDPTLTQELRQRGLQQAAKFTWERTARETLSVYRKVLGEKLP